ncbi:MAG: response regulator transcription factor [Dehalococcoidia bacterium]|jgi:DNA-binding response OmpR family regulator|nr:MAG: DNA-binding response regulator, OmpR family, contains REC and winged-helix (wHTH) domain [Chloroflexota bacterium]|tara:strand:- start:1887 stop:2561 length:675 start_codon:yes stop_codon:yes gene_type:complete
MKKIIIFTKNSHYSDVFNKTLSNELYDFEIINVFNKSITLQYLASIQKIDLIIFDFELTNNLEKITTSDKIINTPFILLIDKKDLSKLTLNKKITDIIINLSYPEELIYRINNVFINKQVDNNSKNIIIIADLIINLDKYTISIANDIVDLTFKEFELLTYLSKNVDKPFSRDSLLNQVWGYDYIGGYRTVDVHIRRIRAKIEQNYQYIHTIRNIGYKITNPSK